MAIPVFPSRAFRHSGIYVNLEPNADVLATFLRYSADQGLARTPREPQSLFVPESLESFAV